MNQECVFCLINKGEIPSATIYENKEFRVILDRFPASKGHILIIPQEHVTDIYDLDPELAGRLFELATRFATIIKKTFGNTGLNIIQNNGAIAGQTVFHYHLHMIPRYKGDDVTVGWKPNQEITAEQLDKYRDEIKKQL